MCRVDRNLENFFFRLHQKSRPLFFILLLLASTIPFVASYLFPDDRPGLIDQLGYIKYFLALVYAPLFETLILQHIPVRFCARKGLVGWRCMAIVIAPFVLAHISLSFSPLPLLNGLSGGTVLGICYLTCSKLSWRYAFAITAALHFFHNIIALILASFF